MYLSFVFVKYYYLHKFNCSKGDVLEENKNHNKKLKFKISQTSKGT